MSMEPAANTPPCATTCSDSFGSNIFTGAASATSRGPCAVRSRALPRACDTSTRPKLAASTSFWLVVMCLTMLPATTTTAGCARRATARAMRSRDSRARGNRRSTSRVSAVTTASSSCEV
jgi:hypothetical protein